MKTRSKKSFRPNVSWRYAGSVTRFAHLTRVREVVVRPNCVRLRVLRRLVQAFVSTVAPVAALIKSRGPVSFSALRVKRNEQEEHGHAQYGHSLGHS